MKTKGAGLLCSIAWILSACGSAVSHDYSLPEAEQEQPVLARLHGKIVGTTEARRDLLAISLIWFPVVPAPGDKQITQSVKWRSTSLLGDVDIDIMHPPPPEAIETTGMMRYGQAELVIYEDSNRNGKLDLTRLGERVIDRVVGRAEGFRAWWLAQGSPAAPGDRGYKPVAPGWSFTYGPITADPDPWLCSPDPEMGGKLSCPRSIREPAQDVSSNSFTIKVSDHPDLQFYAYTGFWGTSPEIPPLHGWAQPYKTDRWPDTTPGWNSPEVRSKICNLDTCDACKSEGCALDLPVAGRPVDVDCNADETVYGWIDCERDPKLGGTYFCHTGHGRRNPNTLPAGWPSCKLTSRN